MIKFAVIGDPIAHSLSPAMQNAGIRALGLDAEYFAVHVKQEQLREFTEQARRGLAGFNITVPHKNAIIPFLDEISREAEVAGSVNTVTVESGRLYGDTTDGYGLAQALREAFSFEPENASITLIGCGGAAHAAAAYFASRKVGRLFLINRTLSKAEDLAEKVRAAYGTEVELCPIDDSAAIADFLKHSDVAIQCTSLGLQPDAPSPIDPDLLPDSIRVYDTIYKETALSRACARRGIPFANGLAMLLHQGARSLEIWTRKKAPVEVMRKVLNAAFAERRKHS